MQSESQNPIQKLHDLFVAQSRWHEPWMTGTVKLTALESTLYYQCSETASNRLEFSSSTTKAEIKKLTSACQVATVGRGDDNAPDETYGKAWKMDASRFSFVFNPDGGLFVALLAKGLCPWDGFDSGIRIEPYKLNVYGKGSFYKSHKNTAPPGSYDRFGSLILVLPVEHTGGNLLLHHHDRILDFDVHALLEGASPTTAAYVAFYNDVDHSLLEVSSGRRVTITCSLHFDLYRGPPTQGVTHRKLPDNAFTTALRQLLDDNAFVSAHQWLGFGFEYEYPHPADQYDGRLHRCLKGPDAFLYRCLTDLGLYPQLKYLYYSSSGLFDFWIMFDDPIQGRHPENPAVNTELDYLLSDPDAMIVWNPGKSEKTTKEQEDIWGQHPWYAAYFANPAYYRTRTLDVDWIMDPSPKLKGYTCRIQLGNPPVREIYYYAVCLFIDVQEERGEGRVL